MRGWTKSSHVHLLCKECIVHRKLWFVRTGVSYLFEYYITRTTAIPRTTQRTLFVGECALACDWTGTWTARRRRHRTSTSSPGWSWSPFPFRPSSTSPTLGTSKQIFKGQILISFCLGYIKYFQSWKCLFFWPDPIHYTNNRVGPRIANKKQNWKRKCTLHRIRAFVKGLCLKNGTHACIGGRYLYRWNIKYNFGREIQMSSLYFLQRWWVIKVFLRYHPRKEMWGFTGNAGIFWRSLKLQRYTGQLSFIFTLRVESSFWSTSTKTWWAWTMSSTLFNVHTLYTAFDFFLLVRGHNYIISPLDNIRFLLGKC